MPCPSTIIHPLRIGSLCCIPQLGGLASSCTMAIFFRDPVGRLAASRSPPGWERGSSVEAQFAISRESPTLCMSIDVKKPPDLTTMRTGTGQAQVFPCYRNSKAGRWESVNRMNPLPFFRSPMVSLSRLSPMRSKRQTHY